MLASTKEKSKNTCLARYGAVSPTLNPDIRKKQINTCIEKYGHESPLRNDDVANKVKNSLISKHGVDTTWKSKKIKEKSQATKISRYGDKNYNNQEKIKNTCLNKYGVSNATKLPQTRLQIEKTCIEKYGTTSPLGNADIIQKSKETNLKKYGVDNPAKSDFIKNKIIKTNNELYGSNSPLGNPELRNIAKQNAFKKYYNNIIKTKFANVIIPLFTESEYIGNISYDKKYAFKCVKCNGTFEDTLCSGNVPRCIACFPVHSGTSKMEKEVVDFVKTILPNEIIVENDSTILSGLELDVYIPNKKFAIELNGNYWHSEVNGKKYKNYHINKTKRCEDAGIHLIHIFEDEWLHKQNIVKDKLTYLLCPQKISKIYARKCIIQSISNEVCNEFLKKTHIQGSDKSSVKYGAYYNNELVSVITFGKNRIALGNVAKEGEYELYRFCSTGSVVGMLSKFISYFIKEHSPKNIITYADRRFSSKEKCGYAKCGFSFVKETSPNYWYMNKKSIQTREHRYKYRKSELRKLLPVYDPTKTEWENMQDNGYDRIWDCGSLRYEMILK
jgi:hypothetical protein